MLLLKSEQFTKSLIKRIKETAVGNTINAKFDETTKVSVLKSSSSQMLVSEFDNGNLVGMAIANIQFMEFCESLPEDKNQAVRGLSLIFNDSFLSDDSCSMKSWESEITNTRRVKCMTKNASIINSESGLSLEDNSVLIYMEYEIPYLLKRKAQLESELGIKF